MTSLSQLRENIEASQSALRRAIEEAAARWERSPGEDEWSPRATAEHALSAELHFALEVGKAAGDAAEKASPERREFALVSAADALSALDEMTAATAPVYEQLAENDLSAAVPFMENIGAFSGDVAGALTLVAYHHNDHAQQIGAGS